MISSQLRITTVVIRTRTRGEHHSLLDFMSDNNFYFCSSLYTLGPILEALKELKQAIAVEKNHKSNQNPVLEYTAPVTSSNQM